MPLPDLATYQDRDVLTPPDPPSYYDSPDGVPCPVCVAPKPRHVRGCSEAPEGEPSYRYNPDDYNTPTWL